MRSGSFLLDTIRVCASPGRRPSSTRSLHGFYGTSALQMRCGSRLRADAAADGGGGGSDKLGC
jgi:hypothetical protein